MALSRKHKHTQNNNNKFRNRSHNHTHHPRHHVTQRKRDRVLRADNFYLWANQKWLREVPKTLPRELKYIRPLDNFKLIQDEMFKNTIAMIRDYTKHNSGSTTAKQMKNVYASFRDLHPEPILAHIADFCKLYKDLVCENNLYKFLGIMNQNEMVKWALPVVWNVYPDEYTPGKLSAHVGTPSLSLYDYRFYLADSILEKQMRGVRLNVSTSRVIRQNQEGGARGAATTTNNTDNDTDAGPEMKTVEYLKYKKRITNAFLRFIDDVFTKCLGRDYETTHNIKVDDVYDIECKILTCMNNLDCRFDESYANIYNTKKQSDKPPHLSYPHAKIMRHRNCECGIESDDGSGCVGDANVKERLKLPHYKNNIRGASRILSQDAMSLVGLDWLEMAKWIGYGETSSSSSPCVPPYFIVNQVGYLSSIMDLLKKEWASDAWKSYWYFMYLRQLICFHDKWREIYLDFNDTLIRGKDTHFPREYFPIIGLAYAFPKTMTEEFTRRYKNEEMISKVREIGNTMLDCYKARITRNTWMSATTKKGALKKLNTIKLCIGEANLSAPDPTNLDYDPKDAWGNLLKRSIQRTEYIAKHHHISSGDFKLSSEDLDIMNWGTMKFVGFQSFVVNAYYTPNSNSIYIPTAYMHSMNVQFGRGYEYDLASVGFTFGHEISHALHVNSRTYNHKGVIKNWWSKDDTATYERKIAAIRRQYEEISRKDGFVIDGNLSLSENLADVTGIAVCEDALNKYHRHVYDDVSDITRDEHVRESSFLNFYTYYAIQNRQYANFREILVQVLTNPHLNLKIRTNVPLMRSKTFHDVIGIKKSDKMYNDDFDVVF